MSPGRVDPEVVLRRLRALDDAVRRLRPHQGRELADLVGDEAWIVERGLQLCGQCVVDVALHIAAALGADPTDYTDAVDALAKLDVLPRPFAEQLRGIPGLRNVLVHDYLRIDYLVIHSSLNERLDDLGTFAEHIVAFLDS